MTLHLLILIAFIELALLVAAIGLAIVRERERRRPGVLLDILPPEGASADLRSWKLFYQSLYAISHPWWKRLLFGQPDGWHVADGFIRRDTREVFPIDQLTAPGLHNALNACAALAALEAIGMDALAAAPALAHFRPLPHRLQPLGEHDGWHWVNDSISTTPLATLAALESLHGRMVTVLVGGHDRGLDWTPFVDAMRSAPPNAIICMGSNGARIEAALHAAEVHSPMVRVDNLASAVAEAKARTPQDGVILLSPGAPSFDQFKDYAERGRQFAELAGFDGAAIAGIDGLGIG